MKTKLIDLENKINYKIIRHPEDMPIKGQFEEGTEKQVIEDYENGNEWAWCLVEVVGTYKGLTSNEFLGGCSYKDEKDFIKGGYYEDMKSTIYKEIKNQLEEILKEHCISL